MMEDIVKMPPLGIKPMVLWLEDRLDEINLAIGRFIGANRPISLEWIEERNEILAKLEELKSNK